MMSSRHSSLDPAGMVGFLAVARPRKGSGGPDNDRAEGMSPDVTGSSHVTYSVLQRCLRCEWRGRAG